MKMHGAYLEATKTPYRFLLVLVVLALAAFAAGVPLGARLPLSSPTTSGGNEGGTGNDNDGGDDGGGGDDGEDGDDGGGGGGGGNEGGNTGDSNGGDVTVESGNRVTNAPIEAREDFAIEISCDRGFQVNAIFVVVNSQDDAFNLIYEQVRGKGDFAGTGVRFWTVFSSSFDPGEGEESLASRELLSFMDLDQVAIPGGGFLVVEGSVQSNSDGALSVRVVIETTASSECRVDVVP